MDQSSSHVPAASRTKHPATKFKNAFGVLARMCRPTILRRAAATVVRSSQSATSSEVKRFKSRGLLAPASARPQWTRRSNRRLHQLRRQRHAEPRVLGKNAPWEWPPLPAQETRCRRNLFAADATWWGRTSFWFPWTQSLRSPS